MNVLLVADDLSGAADAGIRLVLAGVHTRVLLEPERLSASDLRPDAAGRTVDAPTALALDTDSRRRDPRAAAERVRAAFERVRDGIGAGAHAAEHLIKKIDSTMRGHVGEEVEALLRTTGAELSLLTPAHPGQERTVRGGNLSVRGREEELSVPRRLRSQTELPVYVLGLAALREGGEALLERLEGPAEQGAGPRILVADARTDEDLDRLVRAGARWHAGSNRSLLWAGSAGLVGALARSIGPARSRQSEAAAARGGKRRASPPARGSGLADRGDGAKARSVLFVIGSLHPRSRKQLDRLLGQEELAAVEVPAKRLRAEADVEEAGTPVVERVVRALRTGGAAALYTSEEPVAGAGSARARIAEALGEMSARIVREASAPESGPLLFVTGGDTARAVCGALGVTGLDLREELEDGVPVSRTVGGWEGTVVTKAGGFGGPDVMGRALRRVAGA